MASQLAPATKGRNHQKADQPAAGLNGLSSSLPGRSMIGPSRVHAIPLRGDLRSHQLDSALRLFPHDLVLTSTLRVDVPTLHRGQSLLLPGRAENGWTAEFNGHLPRRKLSYIMTEAYTASTVVDIVDALPTFFGFTPSESFIGVATSGPRHRMGFRVRLDIPAVSEADKAGEMLAAHLNANAGDGVVLIALTSDRDKATAITNAVLDHLGPVEVVAALHADTHRVWTYDTAGCIDEADPGLERDTSTVSEAIVQAVAEGRQIWSSREAMAEVFAPATTLTDVTNDVNTVEDGGGVAIEALTIQAIDVLNRYAETDEALTGEQIGTLAVAAQIVAVRDALWGQMTRANAETHAEAWRHTATHTAGPHAAGPYALAAFGYWLTGDGARAAIAVDHALAAAPEHSLADLMVATLTLGLNPDTWNGIPT